MADVPQFWQEVGNNLQGVNDDTLRTAASSWFRDRLWPSLVEQGKARPAQFATTLDSFLNNDVGLANRSKHPLLNVAARKAVGAIAKPIIGMMEAASPGAVDGPDKITAWENEAVADAQRQGVNFDGITSPGSLASLAGSAVGSAPLFALTGNALSMAGVPTGLAHSALTGAAGGAMQGAMDAGREDALRGAVEGGLVGGAMGAGFHALGGKLRGKAETEAPIAETNPPVSETLPANPETKAPIIEPERVNAPEGSGSDITPLTGEIERAPLYEPRPPVRPTAQGRETTIRVPGERTELPGRYVVRELDDLYPSHGPAGEPNPGFDLAGARDYSDPRHAEVINAQVADFDPQRLLHPAPTVTDGPPVIDPSGNVLDGSGRTVTLGRAYAENPTAADAYKDALLSRAREYGIDPESIKGMERPVLVRELPTADLELPETAYDPTEDLSTVARLEGSGQLEPQRLNTVMADLGIPAESSVMPGEIGPRSSEAIPLREQGVSGDLLGTTGGAELPGAPPSVSALTGLTPEGTPYSLFRGANKTDQVHESFHRAAVGGMFDPGTLAEVDPQMSANLRRALPKEIYSGKGYEDEEVFTRLATAFRTGDEATIDHFVRHDGSREQVAQFTADSIKQVQAQVAAKLDEPAARQMQTRLQYTLRKVGQPLPELRNDAALNGLDITTQGGEFRVKMQDGTSKVFSSRDRMVDWLNESDAFPEAPELVSPRETFPGIDPLPPGGGPVRYNATMDPPPPERPVPGRPGERPIRAGWSGFSYYVRPFLPWVETVSKKFDMPELYGSMRTLYEAEQARAAFVADRVDSLNKILKDVPKNRLDDLYEYLRVKEEAAAGKSSADSVLDAEQNLKISVKEKAALEQVRGWLDSAGQEFGITGNQWIADYLPRLRKAAYDPDQVTAHSNLPEGLKFFAEMQRTGNLDARDTNLQRVLYNYVRLGARKKFLEAPYQDALKLVEGKMTVEDAITPFTSETRQINLTGNLRDLLKRHLEFMIGKPDGTQLMIESAIQGTLDSINAGIEKANPKLPAWARMKQVEALPRDVLQKFTLLQYAGGMAFRPGAHIRDLFQYFLTAYPMLGEHYTVRGIKDTVGKRSAAYDLAAKYGAILKDVGEVDPSRISDIAPDGTLSKIAKAGLKPQQMTSNATRIATFMGWFAKIQDAASEFHQSGDAGRFMRQSGAYWLDGPLAQQYMGELAAAGPQGARDVAGRMAADLTKLSQWDTARGAQAGFTKYQLGRMLGQFGTWPANYVEYTRRMLTKGSKADRAAALARLTLMHTAILKAGENLGIDTTSWVFLSPTAYGGGPWLQAATAAPQVFADTKDGSEARHDAIQPFLLGIPGYTAGRTIWKAVVEDDPNLYLKALGFSALTPAKEKSSYMHQISEGEFLK